MDTRHKPAVIGESLNIVGDVVAEERSVELNGKIEGEVCCTNLVIASTGRLVGKITAKKVVVLGSVEGPIVTEELVLAAGARVKGDVACRTLVLAKGASLEGRISRQPAENGDARARELPPQRDPRRRNGQPLPWLDARGRRVH
jgi:cytoskeletal protein CcmA (bactofilin family)